jgi:hypothetical protein
MVPIVSVQTIVECVVSPRGITLNDIMTHAHM